MLHTLYAKNLALIDEIEVDFREGLNILTGETGAGKSIILGSINLALGGRYSSDILRSEDEDGYVELTFFVEDFEQETAADEDPAETEAEYEDVFSDDPEAAEEALQEEWSHRHWKR